MKAGVDSQDSKEEMRAGEFLEHLAVLVNLVKSVKLETTETLDLMAFGVNYFSKVSDLKLKIVFVIVGLKGDRGYPGAAGFDGLKGQEGDKGSTGPAGLMSQGYIAHQ